MTEWFYCLPPDIGVTVQARRKPSLLSRILGEETPSRGEASLVLDLSSRSGEPSRASVSLDPASRALTVRGVYKAIPWSCCISRGAGGGWTLGFRSPVLREYLALHVALIPTLRRLLLDRGVAVIAGAAFELDSEATMLAGLTGRGKTTLLLGALENGARLVGDEYLGLSEQAEVTPLVRALALRRATLGQAPRALRRLSPERRLMLRAAELAALLTRGRLEPLVHVAPSELGARPALDMRTRVRRLFWLESEAGTGSAVRCDPMDVLEAVEQLSIMQAVHDLAYGDLGAFLDAARADCAGADYASRWRQTVERGLRGASCYRLTFSGGDRVFSEVLEHVLPSG